MTDGRKCNVRRLESRRAVTRVLSMSHAQVLISKLDAAHSRPFKEAAAMYSSFDEPMGKYTAAFTRKRTTLTSLSKS